MKQSTNRFRPTTGMAVVTLGAVVALAACSNKADEEAAAALAPNKTHPVGGKVKVPEESRMANAVVSGKTSAPVDLKYDLAAKPDVGQPFEIELAFLPRLPADTLDVTVTGMPGLTLSGSGRVKFDSVQPGQTYTYKPVVQAATSGTYYISIVAKMITQVQTEGRTFSVPVVVGTVPAPEMKAPPPKDASGQAVESMPAKEQ